MRHGLLDLRREGRQTFLVSGTSHPAAELKLAQWLRNDLVRRVLNAIADGQPHRQAEIALRFSVTQSRVSQIVRKAEKLGVLERRRAGTASVYRVTTCGASGLSAAV